MSSKAFINKIGKNSPNNYTDLVIIKLIIQKAKIISKEQEIKNCARF